MLNAPVSFSGKVDIYNYANQYGPLTAKEREVGHLASKYYDVQVDRTSDGDFVGEKDKELQHKLNEALKAFATTPSVFAYKTAVELIDAPANDAIVYAQNNFKKAAFEIAKNDPEVTKEMILEDFDKLS